MRIFHIVHFVDGLANSTLAVCVDGSGRLKAPHISPCTTHVACQHAVYMHGAVFCFGCRCYGHWY